MRIRCCNIIAFVVQETEVSQWEAPDFVFEIDFSHELNTQNIEQSLQLPYANETNTEPNMVYAHVSNHLDLTFLECSQF